MKIALFMLPPLTQGGGAEKYFIELANNLCEREIETDIITMDDKFFSRFVKILYLFAYRKWFREVDISGRESEKDIRENLGRAKWLRTNYKNLAKVLSDYDVIYSKNEIVDLLLLKLKGYKKLPPVIVGVHTPLYFPKAKSLITKIHNFIYLGFFYKWLILGVNCIHVSNASAKKIVDKKFKINNKLIFYPFSVENIQKSAEINKSRINFSTSKINIIFAGRLSEQKGMDRLVRTITRLAKTERVEDKIEVNIFGSSDEKHESMAKKLEQCHSFVHFHGHVENKYIPDILKQHDIFISASRWETLPYNILEAQALGIPTVAFDIPGPNEIIKDCITGFLVKNEDDFYNKIMILIDKKITLDKKLIAQNMKNKFSPAKIYNEMVNMFSEIREINEKNQSKI